MVCSQSSGRVRPQAKRIKCAPFEMRTLSSLMASSHLILAIALTVLVSACTSSRIELAQNPPPQAKLFQIPVAKFAGFGTPRELLFDLGQHLNKVGIFHDFTFEVRTGKNERVKIGLENTTVEGVVSEICRRSGWSYYVSYHTIVLRDDLSVPPLWRARRTWASSGGGGVNELICQPPAKPPPGG
jgi:hypothetical protein